MTKNNSLSGACMPIHTNLTPERRKSMVELGAWNDKIITDYLDEAVASAGDKAAIITYRMADGSRVELSYRELNEKVTRIVAGLVELGVRKGDIVSCQLPNWWQMTALHLACVRIGAVLNPLMPISASMSSSSCWAWPRARCWWYPRPSASSTTAPWPMNSSARCPSWRMCW